MSGVANAEGRSVVVDRRNGGPTYDLLIRGAHVIDPAGGQRGVQDVAIRHGCIADIGEELIGARAAREVDMSGCYLSPGFVDLHTHVFSVMSNCVEADRLAGATGVTTWVDAGSTGGRALAGFRSYVADRARVRILAFLNISAIGGVGAPYTYERLEWCDPKIVQAITAANSDFVVGVKAQMGVPFTSKHGLHVLARAREAADILDLPLMVHISWTPPTISEVLDYMRPGDIVTHAFTGSSMRIVDDKFRLLGSVKDALQHGVKIDVGHGSSSFSFRVAESVLNEGFEPHAISTDIHEASIGGPMFDLPTVMSKFLALGMSLEQVIGAVTVGPARLIGREEEIGNINVGTRADLVCFRVVQGSFTYVDSLREERVGRELIVPVMTLVGGREVHPEAPAPLNPARALSKATYAFHERMEKVLREPAIYRVQSPEDFGPATPLDRDEAPITHEPWTV